MSTPPRRWFERKASWAVLAVVAVLVAAAALWLLFPLRFV